ncbi:MULTISPECIES: beta-L-arabinofuranosidase domain-containing protein [Caproicibacterium]|uniref:Glycoside hydrolase family 127 protein n=1 Tax=Caproicibacterium argilliputei TaxID=3030016 RepID=A0AA97D9K4_9FIRM|nr:beta-L-arabinofuranosidase domain-containing protein [Caproicibacterium argilliputei]WOC31829.1 glycoside hydrolase family 127 protein [Caproicibacterium argilliputei]
MIQPFAMADVTVRNVYFQNAFQKEEAYLLSLDSDRLLACFRETRGLPPKAENYTGWEDTEIRGHTLGHYLTAMAQVYATNGNAKVLERLRYLMAELAQCQFPSGYLSAFPEEFFDRVEASKPVWVPWYTMHKILAGILSVYELAGLPEALQIASALGDWVCERTARWSAQVQANVLAVEYGGMNDCMYELYLQKKEERYAQAAHRFDELALFQPIHDGVDILNNRHANTTIPKFLGALNRYRALGESERFYLETCEAFWEMVVRHHSYVTGGNSEAEHFGESDVLDAERTAQNCETCNTYNMLKLSRLLFQLTGKKKYADFYERTLLNAILPSQNPETGMTMYFQPMATGYFKVYSRPYTDFWCCTGTGMENFSKLNDSLYFHTDDRLFVNLYLASRVRWEEKGITLEQTGEIPLSDTASFTVRTEKAVPFVLCLRVPNWAEQLELRVNHVPAAVREENGYLVLDRIWNNGDTVSVQFQMAPQCVSLPDNPNSVAFTFGPLVLSAGMGTEKMEESNTGIQVRVASKHIIAKDYILCKGESAESWKAHVREKLTRTPGTLEFHLQDSPLVFSPYFRQYDQRYGIYWTLLEEGSPAFVKHLAAQRYAAAVEEATLDSVQIGNDQYELSHAVKGSETEAGNREGYHYRMAKPGGWFSYRLQADGAACLQFQYTAGRCKTAFDVFVEDTLLLHEPVEKSRPGQPVTRTCALPESLRGKTSITVKFAACAQEESAWIVNTLRVMTDTVPKA